MGTDTRQEKARTGLSDLNAAMAKSIGAIIYPSRPTLQHSAKVSPQVCLILERADDDVWELVTVQRLAGTDGGLVIVPSTLPVELAAEASYDDETTAWMVLPEDDDDAGMWIIPFTAMPTALAQSGAEALIRHMVVRGKSTVG